LVGKQVLIIDNQSLKKEIDTSKDKKVLVNQKGHHIGINISLTLKDLFLIDKAAKNVG
jgi:hypothetical protein